MCEENEISNTAHTQSYADDKCSLLCFICKHKHAGIVIREIRAWGGTLYYAVSLHIPMIQFCTWENNTESKDHHLIGLFLIKNNNRNTQVKHILKSDTAEICSKPYNYQAFSKIGLPLEQSGRPQISVPSRPCQMCTLTILLLKPVNGCLPTTIRLSFR